MSRTELRTEVFNYLSPLMDNEQAMQQVLVFLRSIQPTAPCQYSIEEVYEMGMKACEDIHAGESILPHDTAKELAQSWLR